MRILMLSRYGRLGPSSRLRMYQYLPYLAEHGVQVDPAPLFRDRYLSALYAGGRRDPIAVIAAYSRRLLRLLAGTRYDLLWIEKELFPRLPGWFERIVTGAGVPWVVDYDDAVFHDYDRHPNPLVRLTMGRKIDGVMRRAALVVAGNDYLADRARAAGATRVENLPTVVDLAHYPAPPAAGSGVFTIGWIGTRYTAPYLLGVREALAEVCAGGRGRLMLVGACPVELDGIPLLRRDWAEDREARDIQEFDMGIMPLPDGPWERGKCGYKLIQYMACGRPVVAHPIGVNARIVEDGVTGFLASSPQEWMRALTTLRERADLRRAMGRAGRAKVEAEYCLAVTAPKLLALLRSCAGTARRDG